MRTKQQGLTDECKRKQEELSKLRRNRRKVEQINEMQGPTYIGVDFRGQPGHVPLPILEKRLRFHRLLSPFSPKYLVDPKKDEERANGPKKGQKTDGIRDKRPKEKGKNGRKSRRTNRPKEQCTTERKEKRADKRTHATTS